jgi:hypothetical protein
MLVVNNHRSQREISFNQLFYIFAHIPDSYYCKYVNIQALDPLNILVGLYHVSARNNQFGNIVCSMYKLYRLIFKSLF